LPARDPQKILRVTGKLVINPTDLGAAFPYGGTEIGTFIRFEYDPGQDVELIYGEDRGQSVDGIFFQRDFIVAFECREWNNDALSFFYHGTTAPSGNRVVNFPGGFPSGSLLATRAVKLLFVADRLTTHPSLLVYLAMPLVAQNRRIRKSIFNEQRLPVLLTGLPDGSGRVAQEGFLSDLTL
jgi:hypothetical protein